MTRDRLNGGLRLVARRAGFLTAPGEAPPARVALGYVRSHAAAFGLEAADLETLVLTRQYRSESGMTHLQWAQTYRGIPAFDHGLRANVTADGRLINIGGSPRPDLKVPSTEPRLGAVEAVRAAVGSIDARPVGPARGPQLLTLFDGGHRASLVLFGDRERVRLAWRMLLFTSDKEIFDAIVDATSGELLFPGSLVHDVAALVFENYPGAPSGGQQVPTEFPAAWISGNARLFGTYAHVHSDPEDSYFTGPSGPTPAPADEIPPTGDVELRSGCATRGSTPNLPAHRLQLGERRSRLQLDGQQEPGRYAALLLRESLTTTCATLPASALTRLPATSRALTAFGSRSMMAPPPVPATPSPTVGTRTMHP